MATQSQKKQSFWHFLVTDPSTISLLISNLVVIGLAVTQQWNVMTVLWVYWSQSVIIGFFAVIRLVSAPNVDVADVTINDRKLAASWGVRIALALFFVFHYGIFHFVYMIFLFAFSGTTYASDDTTKMLSNVAIGAVLFFINHWFSFMHNAVRDREKPLNLGAAFGAPYGRIIPMHFTIILMMVLGPATLPFFLGLKMVVDLVSHTGKHVGKYFVKNIQPNLIPGVVVIPFKTNPFRVLLIKNAHTGNITPPGGGIDEGENEEEAAVRELKEETGLEVTVDQLVPTMSYHSFTYGANKRERAKHPGKNRIFLVNADQLSDPIETEDGKEPQWKEPSELSSAITFETLCKLVVYEAEKEEQMTNPHV